MRANEFVLDLLNNTRLFEMAYDRKTAKRKFEELDQVIAEHLIKIVAYKDGKDYQHHCSEVNAWLIKLNRVKWNRTQHLDKDTIMQILWDGPLGHGASAVTDTIDTLHRVLGYSVPRNELTPAQIYEILHKIYDEMCFDLSKGHVSSIQTYLTNSGYQVTPHK